MSLTSSGRRALPEFAKQRKHLRLNLNIAGRGKAGTCDCSEQLREMMLHSPVPLTGFARAELGWLAGAQRRSHQLG